MDKIYTFSFPYFADGDIRITIDNAELDISQYSVEKISTSKTNNTNIPFSGGNVHFQTAPAKNSTVRIWREIDLTRHIDYQPTTKLDMITLNQDFNFNIEVLKDFYNKLSDFSLRYANILAMPENDKLLESIQIVVEKIDNFDMPDTDTTQQQITDLTNQINAEIATINDKITELENIEIPDATSNFDLIETYQNGNSWYKIYRETNPQTGEIRYWCEQGGIFVGTAAGSQKGEFEIYIPYLAQTFGFASNTNASSTATAGRFMACNVPANTTLAVYTTNYGQNGYVWNFKGYIATPQGEV